MAHLVFTSVISQRPKRRPPKPTLRLLLAGFNNLSDHKSDSTSDSATDSAMVALGDGVDFTPRMSPYSRQLAGPSSGVIATSSRDICINEKPPSVSLEGFPATINLLGDLASAACASRADRSRGKV
jgi:hypothetical protein